RAALLGTPARYATTIPIASATNARSVYAITDGGTRGAADGRSDGPRIVCDGRIAGHRAPRVSRGYRRLESGRFAAMQTISPEPERDLQAARAEPPNPAARGGGGLAVGAAGRVVSPRPLHRRGAGGVR